MGRTAVVALFLVAVVVAAASVPAASTYGCYDDCYERCANGKTDDACTSMCKCRDDEASTALAARQPRLHASIDSAKSAHCSL
ncbi:hypothetical protein E2562_004359 [Oryza meyeriana var. granulata]|uniref:Bifunctional inhibitor/plant lipid transfer protein/seed storage helical domain-containing protein n=1 Tax=Oryza meyeriana var. granulata TaxID=110450 RepID=A0A6G1CZ25_9ORYZ|nr:hypothetical protein E2562_004359 [Oryza meyeriana var. granulata]